ncbi:MAG: radical SAM family heme chaperone HemW [Bacteroidales bacterium]|jgi:oxygen-independent coproporphyrinogen-3 oxidase|nr:radical SAM family heme chaperone HemW [Bacteroidales bacterium]
MAGIYIHIPFCKQKCHYCNFYTVTSQKFRDGFIPAILKELEQRKDYLEDKTINTVYFGGGTPSMLSVKEIGQIIDKIDQLFVLKNDAEITLETNPDDLDKNKIRELKSETRINRLSMGVQSFHDADLQYLNRVHTGTQALKSIENALAEGFHNMTIDLIYGIPTLTDEQWRKNLDTFFAFGLLHLSSYALTVEPKTVLNTLIEKRKMQAVSEDQTVRHFEILLEKTRQHEFTHYEISNFAREGFYSKHNSIYWLGGHYLGVGPSAHSFNGVSRQWNVAHMKQYIESEKTGTTVLEKEVLTKDQQFNEYVMTSIRTSWGCDAEHIQNVFGHMYVTHLDNAILPFTESGRVAQRGNVFYLTDKGKLHADGIAAALFRE